jgi:hypothetical protein
MTEVAVVMRQGGAVAHTAPVENGQLGRGMGSLWVRAQIDVVRGLNNRRTVVAVMEVPDSMRDLSDEVLVERFIKGFNNSK